MKIKSAIFLCLLTMLNFSASMRLFANNTVDGAVQWAEDQGIGNNWDDACGHEWINYCLHFVGHCYLNTGTGYATALDAWNSNDSTFGPRSSGTAPRGALVFYNISLPNGHVGLSCGDGTMWHATNESGTSHDGVQHDSISRYGSLSLLGWRMPNAWIIPITASDGSGGDHFGYSISTSGDTAIIGAYQDDVSHENSGSAYIFESLNGTWTQKVKIYASNISPFDYFGTSVSISGDTAIIGAPRDWDGDSFVDGDGSAYIFEKINGTWTQTAELYGVAGDWFGYSVSISVDTAIIGAWKDVDNGRRSGSAYIFEKINGTWTQTAKFKATEDLLYDEFGCSVSISGDTAIIGCPTSLIIDDNDEDVVVSGSAYIFEKTNGTWTQKAKLSSDGSTYGNFGNSVSISGDTAIIGAYDDGDNGIYPGSAYIFEKGNGAWTQRTKLTASDGSDDDYFGYSVSISGDTAVIGAFRDDYNGTYSGSAYIFGKTDGSWRQKGKLLACDGAPYDCFGLSVSISGDTAIIGAQGDNNYSGSVYSFDLSFLPTIKLLSQDGAEVVGACADGSTEISIEISGLPIGTTANNITFSTLDPNDGEFVGSPQMYLNGIMARQSYKVPDKFDTETNDNATRNVPYKITVSGVEYPGIIKLARPPVLMLHGLLSSSDSWKDFMDDLKNSGRYQEGFYCAFNYWWTSMDSFETNKNVFEQGYQYLKNQATKEQYAMTKIDVFGHSMGGILAKKYGDPAKINSIITIGTPHFGSPIADLLLPAPDFVYSAFKKIGWDISGGALYDLQVSQCDVKADNLDGVPHTEINGVGVNPYDTLYWLMAFVFHKTKQEIIDDLFEGKRSDYVVDELSQEGGGVGVDADVAWHLGEAAEPDVRNIALDKLENPPAFQPVSKKELELMSIENEKLQERIKELQKRVKFSTKAESLQITSPADGAQFNIGDTINVTVSATAGIQKVYIGCEIGGAVIDESAPFEFQFTPEATAFGQYNIVAIGRDSEGLVGDDSITINISPTADLSVITAYPEGTVILSENVSSIELDIEGQYADAVNRNITSHITGTTYLSSDPSIVTVSEDGIVESGGVFGDATITVTNGTVTKDINVVVTKTSLVVHDWMLY